MAKGSGGSTAQREKGPGKSPLQEKTRDSDGGSTYDSSDNHSPGFKEKHKLPIQGQEGRRACPQSAASRIQETSVGDATIAQKAN